MLGVVMPVWGRAALSGAVLAHWARPEYSGILRMAVRSPEDPDPPYIPPEFEITEWPNERPKAKWQAGADAIRGRVDALMMVGSDDLITPGLVSWLYDAALAAHMAFPSSIYWAEPSSRRIMHVVYRTVFAGITYSAEAMERAGWETLFGRGHLNPADLTSSLEMRKWARRMGGMWQKPPLNHIMSEAVVDLKGEGNVWTYDAITGRVKPERVLPCPTYDAFFNTYFPDFRYLPVNQ